MQTSQFPNHKLKLVGFEMTTNKVDKLYFEYWILKRADFVLELHKELGDLKDDGVYDLINEYVTLNTTKADEANFFGTKLLKVTNFDELCAFLAWI